MKEKLTLQNTNIYFTPSFMGQGWETSLLPKLERGHQSDFSFPITLSWLKSMLLKMQKSGQEKGVVSWTTAIARLFL